jgi:hypothetical protein
MLVVLNSAPKGKLSIVLKAPVEALNPLENPDGKHWETSNNDHLSRIIQMFLSFFSFCRSFLVFIRGHPFVFSKRFGGFASGMGSNHPFGASICPSLKGRRTHLPWVGKTRFPKEQISPTPSPKIG